MTGFTATFVFERSTKNTHRYQEVGSGHIGVLYIQKSAMPKAPDKIKVTVEEAE